MILTLQWIWAFIVTQTTPMILICLAVLFLTGFYCGKSDDR